MAKLFNPETDLLCKFLAEQGLYWSQQAVKYRGYSSNKKKGDYERRLWYWQQSLKDEDYAIRVAQELEARLQLLDVYNNHGFNVNVNEP